MTSRCTGLYEVWSDWLHLREEIGDDDLPERWLSEDLTKSKLEIRFTPLPLDRHV